MKFAGVIDSCCQELNSAKAGITLNTDRCAKPVTTLIV
ncbi:hypothetical protein APTSU1_000197300 [Apodemus speciosus]|uniref:Uncharacterized protein n=1 Tax=Apodemus speciosus TaxID=105296 RepID=A0ABQ0EI19_APOSI